MTLGNVDNYIIVRPIQIKSVISWDGHGRRRPFTSGKQFDVKLRHEYLESANLVTGQIVKECEEGRNVVLV
jgi:hypothetical protein